MLMETKKVEKPKENERSKKAVLASIKSTKTPDRLKKGLLKYAAKKGWTETLDKK